MVLFSLFYFLYTVPMIRTTSAVFIHRAHVPVLVRERSGILFCLHLSTGRDRALGSMILGLNRKIGLSRVRSVGLCCKNARTLRSDNGGHFTPIKCVSDGAPKGALTTGPSCSVGESRMAGPNGRIILGKSRGLFPKVGCF